MPVSILRCTRAGLPIAAATFDSSWAREPAWMHVATSLRTTLSISPGTIAPRIRIGAPTPADRSSSASVESPTPIMWMPSSTSRCASTTAPWP